MGCLGLMPILAGCAGLACLCLMPIPPACIGMWGLPRFFMASCCDVLWLSMSIVPLRSLCSLPVLLIGLFGLSSLSSLYGQLHLLVLDGLLLFPRLPRFLASRAVVERFPLPRLFNICPGNIAITLTGGAP